MIRIGTRGSKLALWQANYVKQCLINEIPEMGVSINVIKTSGDKIQNRQLSEIGGKGLFVKEIEEALIAGNIDIAVHSMKDVPAEIPAGLHIGAVVRREDPRDVFISGNHKKFYDLPAGSVIGTGSLRRKIQILSLRNDLVIQDVRGNVDTRLRKLSSGKYDAIILAAAGIKRLGLTDRIVHAFSPEEIIPSPGQGIIGIESRSDDVAVTDIIKKINHTKTELSAKAERNFVRILGGDCNLPLACHLEYLGENDIKISGFVASLNGNELIKESVSGSADKSIELSSDLAHVILSKGGKEIIESYKQ